MQHLLLGAQETFLVTAAIADQQIAVAGALRRQNVVGALEGERERLFHQRRLAERQRAHDRRNVLLLGGRNDDGINVGMRNDGVIVGGVKIGAGRFGKSLGAGGIAIGDREESHRRMLG